LSVRFMVFGFFIRFVPHCYSLYFQSNSEAQAQ
jgi:hypothetical protein